MNLAFDTTYSFRAECQSDVDRFFIACKKANIIVDEVYIGADPNGLPDKQVEFNSPATLEALKCVARSIEDGHVLPETLRACPLTENSLQRDYVDKRALGTASEMQFEYFVRH